MECPLPPLQTFLVRRDSSLKHLVLCVHFPSLNESSSEVLEYTIKEEKSSEYHLPILPPTTQQQQMLHPVTTDTPLRPEGSKVHTHTHTHTPSSFLFNCEKLTAYKITIVAQSTSLGTIFVQGASLPHGP